MGSGIRPKGPFGYAALRYKEERPACFNFRLTRPDRTLCEDRCVHEKDCRQGT
jgi:hypothetical protein